MNYGGIIEMIKMGSTRECVNCKHSKGSGSDVWCGHDPKGKETYMAETDCPYFEGDKYYQGPYTLTIKAETFSIPPVEKTCANCAIRYKDGFCMQHCYYTGDEDTCPQWSDVALEFDYKILYRLCKDYIKLCDDYEESKALVKKYPEERGLSLNMHNYEFFFTCVVNDLHRELSLWKTKR